PVHAFFPAWRQGEKRAITIRHLLEHTSGLRASPTTEEIYASPDFVRLALGADLVSKPGAAFAYNNKAVNLLVGIVGIVAGRPLDDLVRAELFAPLGITEFAWMRDRAGNPHGMSGLSLGAHDLARIGQMLLDGGQWKGRRI